MEAQQIKTEVVIKESIFDKTILELNDAVSINPHDISSLEETKDTYIYWGAKTSNFGTIITMRTGAKLFVAGLTRAAIREKVDAFMRDRMSR